MTAFDPKVSELFNAAQDSYQSAQARTGEGQAGWPDAGEYEAIITGINAESIERKYAYRANKNDPNSKVELGPLPAIRITFNYEILPADGDPRYLEREPEKFRGTNLDLCFHEDLRKVPSDASWVFDQDLGRFKGAAGALLDKNFDDCVDAGADFEAMTSLISGDEAVVVKLRITERKDNRSERTYKTDYISERIS